MHWEHKKYRNKYKHKFDKYNAQPWQKRVVTDSSALRAQWMCAARMDRPVCACTNANTTGSTQIKVKYKNKDTTNTTRGMEWRLKWDVEIKHITSLRRYWSQFWQTWWNQEFWTIQTTALCLLNLSSICPPVCCPLFNSRLNSCFTTVANVGAWIFSKRWF